jgi:hypothetical protein
VIQLGILEDESRNDEELKLTVGFTSTSIVEGPIEEIRRPLADEIE